MASEAAHAGATKGISLHPTVDGIPAGARVAIVRTEWNRVVVDALVRGAREELVRLGVAKDDVVEIAVPGAYELPFGAKCAIAGDSRIVAVVCIGCLIKGETMHFEYIAEAVTQGIMRVQLDSGVPVVFGVLTVLTDAQAHARAGLTAGSHNHGVEWGQTAVRMAALAGDKFRK